MTGNYLAIHFEILKEYWYYFKGIGFTFKTTLQPALISIDVFVNATNKISIMQNLKKKIFDWNFNLYEMFWKWCVKFLYI